MTVDAISETIDKITVGEAKFVNIKGRLPELSILENQAYLHCLNQLS